MALEDEKISVLTAATTVSGADLVPIVQDGTTKKAAISVVLASPFSVTGNATAGAELRLPEDTDNGSNYVALKAPNSLSANLTFTLPAADGTSGQFIMTDGFGGLSFGDGGGGGGGAVAPLTLNSGTLTADDNALSVLQTWNNSGVAFSGAIRVDVTKTAAAAGSKLIDFVVDETSVMSVQRNATTGNHTSEWRLVFPGGSSIGYAAAYGGITFRDEGNTADVGFYCAGFTCSGGATIGSELNAGGVYVTKVGWRGALESIGFRNDCGMSWSASSSTGGAKDVGIARNAAGVIEVNDGNTAGAFANIYVKQVRTQAVTVSALPSASTAGAGSRAFVTDANATTFASVVAGGGSNGVPVYSDGTNWRIG